MSPLLIWFFQRHTSTIVEGCRSTLALHLMAINHAQSDTPYCTFRDNEVCCYHY